MIYLFDKTNFPYTEQIPYTEILETPEEPSNTSIYLEIWYVVLLQHLTLLITPCYM